MHIAFINHVMFVTLGMKKMFCESLREIQNLDLIVASAGKSSVEFFLKVSSFSLAPSLEKEPLCFWIARKDSQKVLGKVAPQASQVLLLKELTRVHLVQATPSIFGIESFRLVSAGSTLLDSELGTD